MAATAQGRRLAPPPLHPIAVWGGDYDDRAGFEADSEGTLYWELDEDNPLEFGGPITWNRPHATSTTAPYSRGFWQVFAQRETGSGNVTVTCEAFGSGLKQSTDITVSLATLQRFDLDADGSALVALLGTGFGEH